MCVFVSCKYLSNYNFLYKIIANMFIKESFMSLMYLHPG